MNIIQKLTYENLRRNKKRTIVTIIGVILSTALLCAAAGLVASARESIIRYEKEANGDFHVMFDNVPAQAEGYITENAQVESYFRGQNLGYAQAEQSKNEYKPYFYVKALDADGLAKAGVHLSAGRFPENDREVLLPEHALTNGGMTYRIGDELTIVLGTRAAEDGTVLTQADPLLDERPEVFTAAQEKTYTIVGIISRPGQTMESFSAPGYTLITVPSESKEESGFVAVRYKKARDWYDNTKKIAAVIEQETGVTVSCERNQYLLRYEGALSDTALGTIYALGVIILLIILATSVFVIRNSFRISVAEKTAQYGMLASVGATSRQIRDSVLYEGFLIGLAGIPLGIAGGTFALAVLTRIVNTLLPVQDLGFRFTFSLPLSVIAVSVLLGGLTIFLSSLIPAVHAGKIPPIVAIRGNEEYKVSKKQVRISKLTGRLFGIGGVIAAKNLKRSRSKYRTTVVSLVVSVAVFIALSSFVSYTRRATGMVYTDYQWNMQVRGLQSGQEAEKLAQEIGETDYSYASELSALVDLEKYGTEEEKAAYKDYYESTPEEYRKYLNYNCTVVYLNRDYFERFARSLGYDGDFTRMALLNDSIMTQDEEGGRAVRYIYKDVEKTGFAFMYTAGTNDEDIPIAGETVEIADIHRIDRRPMGYESIYSDGGMLFVSEDFAWMPEKDTPLLRGMYINSAHASETETKLNAIKSEDSAYAGLQVYNLERNANDEKNMILLIEIFLYGFITVITLVGVTNIFNTITTNMILRSKEFAMLKSVGMTSGQFHRMIRLESLLYGAKSLMIGVPLGVLGSVLIYRAYSDAMDLGYRLPIVAILLAAVFVFVIVGLTMWYSLAKIEKQNIVETIRSDAI
ncbi:MAG: FtsX-like permease family protein [Lachnospiraceae bacterium]|nr:FtsX-like permease family protein [Lachnospiraceae bacterium]